MQGINSGRIFNKNDHFEVNCGNKIDLDYTVCIDCGDSKKLDKMFNYSKKRKNIKKQVVVIIVIDLAFLHLNI